MKERLRSDRGSIAQVSRQFGRSVLGAPLEIFLPERSQPRLLILAGQHGDEPETTSLLSAALRTVQPEQLQAAVILSMNPDGLCRGTRGNARGVDLNRNFPTKNWGEGEVLYRWSSEEPRDVRLSPGMEACSEPETKALLSVLQEFNPEYIISLHAPLSCIDDPLETPLGKHLAERTGLRFVTEIGYPTPGSFGTWALEQQKRVVTWELPHLSLEEARKRYVDLLCECLTGTVVF